MYSNPKIPEGINTSKEHPLKEFTLLIIGALLLIVSASLLFGFFGSWLAGKIPFSAEVKIANLYEISLKKKSPEQRKLQIYLQSLADIIGRTQQLPSEMKITVHYLTGDTLNAFATLGGHIILYRGLLEKLPSENALVMLLAHEIAHVKYRHPIKSLGRGVAAGIAIATISGSSKSSALGEAGLLTTLHYTREMEQQSDEEAMLTLHKLYGHIGGGADLFKEFQKMRDKENSHESPAFFSSHPLDQDRIDNFERMAKLNNWEIDGALTPLAEAFNINNSLP